MFIIRCPYCGERDHSEFSYGGEAHIVRPKQPTELSDDQWAEYLFMRKNIKGLQYERWNHAHGCRRWFNMARDTSNDNIHSRLQNGRKTNKIMSNKFRLSSGGQINRIERVSFKFNGKTFYGFIGDTLASALLANGIHLVGRSFKYHRPRGIFSSGVEETNALVQVVKDKGKTDPNLRATQIEIFEGFNAESQNCWPTVNFDVGAINNLFSPIIPAGFYYKTFMWPANLWGKYEHFIRKAAGLGKSPTESDPDIYDHKYYHCDVLIVGSGASGIICGK